MLMGNIKSGFVFSRGSGEQEQYLSASEGWILKRFAQANGTLEDCIRARIEVDRYRSDPTLLESAPETMSRVIYDSDADLIVGTIATQFFSYKDSDGSVRFPARG
jgi:hypothetical protein